LVQNGNSATTDLSLEAMKRQSKLVQIFASEDKLNSLRAAKLPRNFVLLYSLKGAEMNLRELMKLRKLMLHLSSL
jgi:hypothetical protein